MRIDEVSVLLMVLHTRTHAAPHVLVGYAVDAVRLRPERSEIDIAAGAGVLGGEDVVVHARLVEVCILAVMEGVEEILRELEHVVRVAALGAVQPFDVAVTIVLTQEMLLDGVATYAHGAVPGYVRPEVDGCRAELGSSGGRHLVDADETHVLGHLRIGMLSAQEIPVQRLHAVHHAHVAVSLGCLEVFLLTEHAVGIGQCLVHAAMLRPQYALQGIVAESAHHEDAPVAYLAEHLPGHRGTLARGVILCVEGDVAQSRQNLVLAVERHRFRSLPESIYIALIEFSPVVVHGLSAHEAVHARLVLVIDILAVLHHPHDVVDAFQQPGPRGFVVAGRIGQCESRHVVSSHVSAQVEVRASPVGMVGVLLLPLVIGTLWIGGLAQSSLPHVGCEQAVHVITHEVFDVAVLCRLQGTVQQVDFFKVEMLGIEFTLGLRRACHQEHGHRSDKIFLHLHWIFLDQVSCRLQRYK